MVATYYRRAPLYTVLLFDCSTLTQIEEPYPMLVLCGPPGSGKGYFCKLLVEEFPGFFGLGYVCMSTVCQ